MTRLAVFLVFLLFLWEVERGVSDRDHCTRNGCFSVVQDAAGYASAEKNCRENFFGHLMAIRSTKEHDIVLDLLDGLSGDYWIGLKLPDGKCPADRATEQLLGYEWATGGSDTEFNNWDEKSSGCSVKCVSVSAGRNATWRQRPCDGDINVKGFLCMYSYDSNACNTLPAETADHLVRYLTPRGSAVAAGTLDRFPPGGTAIQKPLDVKHICFSGQWLKAPWNCDVLDGGCEHKCVSQNGAHSCTCLPGQSLRANNVTCGCSAGYAPAEDGKSCVVDDCANCTGPNLVCTNKVCMCRDGFDMGDDGQCVNNEICYQCEHDLCAYKDGAFACECRSRYTVSDKDPTRCQPYCTEQICAAFDCVSDPDKPGKITCVCPDGFIKDASNETRVVCEDMDECLMNDGICDHTCTNTMGSYACSCWEGYELLGDKCVSTDEDEEDGSSGSVGPHLPSIKPTPRLTPPAVVVLPQYVKAGSILGILLFVALFMGLLYFLVHNALKRCGKFELESLRATDVDIFHLQQVTTEKYQKFSFDKQWKNDSQRL